MDLLLRKSKVVREGERALSIRAQEERGRAWAEENSYRVRKVWKENLSAWSDVQRPKYDAAMDAVLNGEVPALWCYALDRFSRKGAEAVVPILGKARVIFDYERLDSMDERDRRWIIDRAENAREYSQRLSYNVRSTKNRQRNEGRWLARAPFGLVADPGTRKLSPDHTPYICLVGGKREITPWQVVVRIYEEIAGGMSARALSRAFNAEGIVSATGKSWTASSVRAILMHPVYEGWLTLTNAGRIPAHYINPDGDRVRCVTGDVLPQMIPADLAARARRLISGHQMLDASVRRPGRRYHPLTGLLRCAGCGHSVTYGGGSYECQFHSGGGKCDAPASVTRTGLERYVVEAWAARLDVADDEDEIMIAVSERWQALTRPEETQEIKDARAELKAAQAKLDKFMADDAADFYTGRSARYRIPHKNAAERRLDHAEARIRELTGDTRVDAGLVVNGHALKMWEAAAPGMRHDLLALAIDHVTVSKSPKPGGFKFNGDQRVTITWATPEPSADDYSEAA
ncbi:recombinase family protein [Streptomyces sp. JV176]|uniref:recombinase family protein n=1 Tax=Streptomyces sp. JV176 TaxID=858630 RepID=UPI002E781C4A|nr:recombinase family protein [Streptomyces sp. JV176]MEE1803911.1 recombinase family protein [Streptomyces sp. JV176]